jgi:hypothetical protein
VQCRNRVIAVVHSVAEDVLVTDIASDEVPFVAQGMGSMLAAQFRDALQAGIGDNFADWDVRLPATLVPNPDLIAQMTCMHQAASVMSLSSMP